MRSPSNHRVAIRLVVVALMAWPLPLLALGAVPDAEVLVVFSNNRLLPANVAVDRGLNTVPAHAAQPRVHFFAEFMDAPTFSGEAYETSAAEYLRRKYAARKLRAVVAGGAVALDFLLRHRARMFPDVPLVHVGVDRNFLAARDGPLPADVVGIPVSYDVPGTLELALRLHPAATRLVVVTGAMPWDRGREADVRRAVAALGLTLPVEYLTGLAQAELTARLASLPADAVVFTPGYFGDDTGFMTIPRDSAEVVAKAASAPVYALFSTQIGSGVVGGRMASYEDMGRATRAIIDRIVGGTPVASLAVPASLVAPVQLDWRQVRRWNIASERIPSDAIVHFREPSLWETYRTQTLIALMVLVVQSGLIAALLIERRLRRRTAAALADKKQELRLALDAARLSTFVWHTAGGDAAGAAPRPGLTASRGESIAQVLAGVHPADRDRVQAAIVDAAMGETELDVEYRALDRAGGMRWLAARGRITTDGQTSSITGVRSDVTTRKEAELQAESDRVALRRLSRVSTMGQLSAALAHQLNQPLTAILGNAETVRKMQGRANVAPEEMCEIMDDIIAETNRAAQVIRRLGDLYRRGDLEFTTLDLDDLVRETVDLLRAELVMRHVTPLLPQAESRATVRGNRVQLQQLLMNLILNAADAMAAMPPDTRMVCIRTFTEDGRVHTCVTDNGEGIPEESLGRVFQPFWTTKEHGLGVGLAICHTIAQAHGGTLTAVNNAEGGATFCLRVPAAPQPAEEARHASRLPG